MLPFSPPRGAGPTGRRLATPGCTSLGAECCPATRPVRHDERSQAFWRGRQNLKNSHRGWCGCERGDVVDSLPHHRSPRHENTKLPISRTQVVRHSILKIWTTWRRGFIAPTTKPKALRISFLPCDHKIFFRSLPLTPSGQTHNHPLWSKMLDNSRRFTRLTRSLSSAVVHTIGTPKMNRESEGHCLTVA